jgi:hypothetical protein
MTTRGPTRTNVAVPNQRSSTGRLVALALDAQLGRRSEPVADSRGRMSAHDPVDGEYVVEEPSNPGRSSADGLVPPPAYA